MLKDFLQLYGPLGIGWIAALILGLRVISERRPNNIVKSYHEILAAYHEATLENTRVMERLAVLIEERTRRHRG